MKTIRLHGWLGQKFGKSFELDVLTPAEAIRALCYQLPGFKRALADDTDGFKCFAADAPLAGRDLLMPFSSKEVFHVVPVVVGSGEGKSPVVQIIIGIIILVAAFYTGGAAATLMGDGIVADLVMQGVVAFGTAMILGGISTLLFAPPKAGSTEAPDNKPSYNFNGAVNTVQQGGCIPLLYGELICGSQVVSAGLFVEDVAL